MALDSIGALTARAHNRSSLLDFLIACNVVGLRLAATHLRRAHDRATADPSGRFKGFGIILASLLYTGPLEVRPLPATSAVLGRALRRLSDDYLAVHGHRVLAVEAFTDPARHTGACYAAANFAQVGEALGHGRCAAALPILSARSIVRCLHARRLM